MRILLLLCAVLLCQGAAAAPLSPDDAVGLALSVDPQVRAAQARLQQAQAAHARALAPQYNPTIRAQLATNGERAGLSMTQPFSLTGARRWQRQLASADMEAAQAALKRTRLDTAAKSRQAYADAVVTTAVAHLARENVALSARLEDAARLRHEEGEASLLDLRLTRLASARAASWLLEASNQEVHALQQLSVALGQPVAAADLLTDPLQVAPAIVDAAPSRSDVEAAEAALRAASIDQQRQRAAALPPVSLGAFVEQEHGHIMAGPLLGWELPVFGRNQLAQAAAQGAVRVAEAELATTTARASAEVATTTARHQEAEALLSALGPGLPEEAAAAMDGIALAYRAGHTDLLSTLLLQSEVVQGQVALIVLRGQLAQARLARLLAAEGVALLAGEQQ